MRITDKERKKYIKEIKSLLICSRKAKKDLTRDIEASIDDLLASSPDAGIDDIRNAVGTPQEIAEGFMDNMLPDEIKKRLTIKRVIIAGCILVIAIIIVFFSLAFIDVYQNNRGHYIVTVVEDSSGDETAEGSGFFIVEED